MWWNCSDRRLGTFGAERWVPLVVAALAGRAQPHRAANQTRLRTPERTDRRKLIGFPWGWAPRAEARRRRRISIILHRYIQLISASYSQRRSTVNALIDESAGRDTGIAACVIHSLYWEKRAGRDSARRPRRGRVGRGHLGCVLTRPGYRLPGARDRTLRHPVCPDPEGFGLA